MQGENEIGDCGTAQLAAARAQEAQWLWRSGMKDRWPCGGKTQKYVYTVMMFCTPRYLDIKVGNLAIRDKSHLQLAGICFFLCVWGLPIIVWEQFVHWDAEYLEVMPHCGQLAEYLGLFDSATCMANIPSAWKAWFVPQSDCR
jgi:hypothetical protein